MLRTFLFDMGNVLIPFDINRGYQALSHHSGLPQTEVAERIRHSGLYNAYESGQLETEEFLDLFSSLLGLTLSLEAFREVWNSIFLPHTATSEELILTLKQNHRLVLLSNTNDLHYQWLRERYPILEHFDAFTLSYAEKAMKPDQRIYAAAVSYAQCSPSECFFTDDIERYVLAARDFGIDAELFTGEADLRRQLAARGLNLS